VGNDPLPLTPYHGAWAEKVNLPSHIKPQKVAFYLIEGDSRHLLEIDGGAGQDACYPRLFHQLIQYLEGPKGTAMEIFFDQYPVFRAPEITNYFIDAASLVLN